MKIITLHNGLEPASSVDGSIYVLDCVWGRQAYLRLSRHGDESSKFDFAYQTLLVFELEY